MKLTEPVPGLCSGSTLDSLRLFPAVGRSVYFCILACFFVSMRFPLLQAERNCYESYQTQLRLPIHVRCLLDEFANLGQIPRFEELLATMRSMEISANVIIQNLSQLKKMYKDSWENVLGNCDSLLFLGGQEPTTLEHISKTLGNPVLPFA